MFLEDNGLYSPSLIFISKKSQQVGHIVAIFLWAIQDSHIVDL